MLPLSALLQRDGSLATHPQSLSLGGGGRHLQEESTALTSSNTRPLRVLVDFASLYEATAPEYSACFTVGQWFRRGLPLEQTPPADGVETCERDDNPSTPSSFSSGCWGRCAEADLIIAADRKRLEDVMSTLVQELTSVFAVRPVDKLTFQVNRGEYQRALQSRGYNPPASCACDCTVLEGVAVNPQYCSRDGGLAHGYDVVVSITKPPVVAGIRGTGGACAFDEARRPLWLVFAWYSTLVGFHRLSVSRAVSTSRAFVRHELLHGLGFVNSMFFYARDSRGARKNLIELRPVRDVDGSTDEVWHFTRGRAYELAQLYFNCDGNATGDATSRKWDGLPLMGLPEMGRGAHWETRIMRDDVMSYGFREAISSITLAALEDLGFYLANYSAAQCMNWGRGQGCEYVRSRCGIGRHDRSATFTPASAASCRGDPFWSAHVDVYLSSKCASGNDPCSSRADSGYEAIATSTDASRSARCDIQCYLGEDVERGDCKAPPQTAVEATSTILVQRLREQLSSVRWESLVVPLLVLIGLCSVLAWFRACLCNTERARPMVYALSIAQIAVAVAALVGSGYLYVNHVVYAAFVNLPTVYALAVLSTLPLLFSMGVLVALAWRAKYPLRLAAWVLAFIIATEVVGIFMFTYCACPARISLHLPIALIGTALELAGVHSLGSMPSDALVSMLGDAHRRVDDFLGSIFSQPIAVAEGVVCRTYQGALARVSMPTAYVRNLSTRAVHVDTVCCRDDAFKIIERAQEDAGNVGTDGVDGMFGSGEVASGEMASGASAVRAVLRNASTHCLASPQHEGATTDLELTIRDPSTENFCSCTPSPAKVKTLLPTAIAWPSLTRPVIRSVEQTRLAHRKLCCWLHLLQRVSSFRPPPAAMVSPWPSAAKTFAV